MDLCSLLDCVFNLVRGACILYSIRRAHCVVTLRNWRCRLQNPSSSLQGNFSCFSEMWEVSPQTSNDRREIWRASVFRNATSLCTSSSAKFCAQAAQTPYLLLGRGQELTSTKSYLTFKIVGPACQNIAGTITFVCIDLFQSIWHQLKFRVNEPHSEANKSTAKLFFRKASRREKANCIAS